MTRFLRRLLREERGATLALTAVMIAGVMSMLALALDLGQLHTAKVEAQRAADSGALAGASVFLNILPASAALVPAEDKAIRFAVMNKVRNSNVDSAEVQVQVDTNTRRVWVQVERQGISLWFAKLFGRKTSGVRASAVAQASPANSVDCLAPLALPDWWAETDPTEDVDQDRIWDFNEDWTYEGGDPQNWYAPSTPALQANESGFGSTHRNGWGQGNPHYNWDQGRDLIIKSQNPQQWSSRPGFFYPIRLPGNADGTVNPNQGARDYRDSFTDCRARNMQIGDTIPMEMGNMVGPTISWVDDVVGLDPTGSWNVATNSPNSPFGWNSPRLLTIALFSPEDIPNMQGGNHWVVPNNFGLYWVEGCQNTTGNGKCQAQSPIIGRFVQFAQGSGGGGQTGSLVLNIQLIK
jgi:hypothetical protein